MVGFKQYRSAHVVDTNKLQICCRLIFVWTPDGRRIIFSSNRGGQNNLWWQAADGTGGTAERLTTSSNTLMLKAPGTDASAAPTALIVVQPWDEELKRLVPAGT